MALSFVRLCLLSCSLHAAGLRAAPYESNSSGAALSASPTVSSSAASLAAGASSRVPWKDIEIGSTGTGLEYASLCNSLKKAWAYSVYDADEWTVTTYETSTTTFSGTAARFFSTQTSAENIEPYTLCDGWPRINGTTNVVQSSSSNGVLTITSFETTSTVFDRAGMPGCTIGSSECEALSNIVKLGDVQNIGTFPFCGEATPVELRTTLVGAPICRASPEAHVRLLYWPQAEAKDPDDLCRSDSLGGLVTSDTISDEAPLSLVTLNTTLVSPTVYIEVYGISSYWTAFDLVVPQSSESISSRCAQPGGGFGPPQSVNWADFEYPVPASAYRCQPKCFNDSWVETNTADNGQVYLNEWPRAATTNLCSTFWNEYEPALSVPPEAGSILRGLQVGKCWWDGGTSGVPEDAIFYDPPIALARRAGPAAPTMPVGNPATTTSESAGPTAEPQDSPSAVTPSQTQGADPTLPPTPEDPPESDPSGDDDENASDDHDHDHDDPTDDENEGPADNEDGDSPDSAGSAAAPEAIQAAPSGSSQTEGNDSNGGDESTAEGVPSPSQDNDSSSPTPGGDPGDPADPTESDTGSDDDSTDEEESQPSSDDQSPTPTADSPEPSTDEDASGDPAPDASDREEDASAADPQPETGAPASPLSNSQPADEEDTDSSEPTQPPDVDDNSGSDDNAEDSTQDGSQDGTGSEEDDTQDPGSDDPPAPSGFTAIGTTLGPAGTSAIALDNDNTLAPGGPALVVSEQTISLDASGTALVVDGSTQEAQPESAPTHLFSVDGTTVAQGAALEVTLPGGETLAAGGPAVTVSDQTFSLAPEGSALVVDGSTQSAQPQPQSDPAAIFTAGGTSFAVAGTSEIALPDGQTLRPGSEAVTVSDQVISLAPSGSALVVDGITQTPESPSTPDLVAVITYGDNTVTADAESRFSIAPSVSLAPGEEITVDETTMSLDEDASQVVVNGETQAVETQPAGTAIASGSILSSSTTSAPSAEETDESEEGDVPVQVDAAPTLFASPLAVAAVAVVTFFATLIVI